jgi:hypothetical protein
MSVMLSFGLALGSISYKQEVLASSAIESQYAFYAADAGLECALFADQVNDAFDYNSHTVTPPSLMTCDNTQATRVVPYTFNATQLIDVQEFSLDSGRQCADITVYKPNPSAASPQTYIFSQGYDVPCSVVATPAGARIVARGENITY